MLNLYPGATVRSTDPQGGITYNQQQFTGGNALSVLENISGKLDFSTGVGPGAESLVRLNHTGRRARFETVLSGVVVYGIALGKVGQTADVAAAAAAVAAHYRADV